MSRRPANVLQSDIARSIRAAKQCGAAEVEVRAGASVIIIRLEPSTAGIAPALEPDKEIVL